MINISFRTPAQFLEEVLLVDDFSDKEDLGEVKLEEKKQKKEIRRTFSGFEELHPDLQRTCPSRQKH